MRRGFKGYQLNEANFNAQSTLLVVLYVMPTMIIPLSSVGIINHLFSVWYITEVCLRMHAYGIKDFFMRRLGLGITLFTVSCVHTCTCNTYTVSLIFLGFPTCETIAHVHVPVLYMYIRMLRVYRNVIWYTCISICLSS